MTDVNIKELRECCAANEKVDNPILRHSETDHVTNGLGYRKEIPSMDADTRLADRYLRLTNAICGIHQSLQENAARHFIKATS